MDLLVCSRQDPASRTLRDAVLDRVDLDPVDDDLRVGDGLALIEIDDMHLDHDHVDRDAAKRLDRDVDRVAVLSRHQSEAGVPSLTVHPIGNFTDAPYGGEPETLVPAPTSLIAPMLRGLARRVPDRYEATLEATHHGPYLETPTCFVEIGSDEEAWQDVGAAEAVVGSLLEALDADPGGPVTVGVGGGHYQPRVTDVARTYDLRLGHMLPDYQIQGGIDAPLVDRLLDATPGVEAAYLDRKSLGNARTSKAEDLLGDRGIDVVRSDDLDRV